MIWANYFNILWKCRLSEHLVIQLLIPDQVAREFANNRPKKIGEMFDAISKKRNGIPSLSIGQYPLLEGMIGYTEALRIEQEMKDILKRYHISIGKTVDEVKNWSLDDPVSFLYRDILTTTHLKSISGMVILSMVYL